MVCLYFGPVNVLPCSQQPACFLCQTPALPLAKHLAAWSLAIHPPSLIFNVVRNKYGWIDASLRSHCKASSPDRFAMWIFLLGGFDGSSMATMPLFEFVRLGCSRVCSQNSSLFSLVGRIHSALEAWEAQQNRNCNSGNVICKNRRQNHG